MSDSNNPQAFPSVDAERLEHENSIRCIANEIMRQLWQSGNLDQLRMLGDYCNWSIKDIEEKAAARAKAESEAR